MFTLQSQRCEVDTSESKPQSQSRKVDRQLAPFKPSPSTRKLSFYRDHSFLIPFEQPPSRRNNPFDAMVPFEHSPYHSAIEDLSAGFRLT